MTALLAHLDVAGGGGGGGGPPPPPPPLGSARTLSSPARPLTHTFRCAARRWHARAEAAGGAGARHEEDGSDIVDRESAVALHNGLLSAAVEQHPKNLARLKAHKLLVRELALPGSITTRVRARGTNAAAHGCACCTPKQQARKCASVRSSRARFPHKRGGKRARPPARTTSFLPRPPSHATCPATGAREAGAQHGTSMVTLVCMSPRGGAATAPSSSSSKSLEFAPASSPAASSSTSQSRIFCETFSNLWEKKREFVAALIHSTCELASRETRRRSV
jgi:hypothetical protein